VFQIRLGGFGPAVPLAGKPESGRHQQETLYIIKPVSFYSTTTKYFRRSTAVGGWSNTIRGEK